MRLKSPTTCWETGKACVHCLVEFLRLLSSNMVHERKREQPHHPTPSNIKTVGSVVDGGLSYIGGTERDGHDGKLHVA